MRAHKHFGDLTVATILDCAAPAEAAAMVSCLVSAEIETSGADLVVTNQSHTMWQRAFRESGFLAGPSNYLLATSKPLSQDILAAGGVDRIHVTRGDGDGRIHL